MSFDCKKSWTETEDMALVRVINDVGTKNWNIVSTQLKRSENYHRTGKQCRERWNNHLNPKIVKTTWTEQEDALIFELYKKFGRSWTKISEFLPGRSDNSVKNRFYTYLRKNLRSYNKSRPHGKRIIGSIRSILRDSKITDFLLSHSHSQTKDYQKIPQVAISIPTPVKVAPSQSSKPQNFKIICPQPLSTFPNDDSSLEDAKLLIHLSTVQSKPRT